VFATSSKWAAAEAAPLYRMSPLSCELRDALEELDEIDERMRRENPELNASWLAPSAIGHETGAGERARQRRMAGGAGRVRVRG